MSWLPPYDQSARYEALLPIDDAAVRLASTEGKAFDVYGDVAQNDGRQGYAHRHSTLLQEVVRIARSVWGARVQLEPDDYLPYSTYRPDMAVPYAGDSGSTYLGELKFIDPLSSNPANIQRRGAYIAFGNTESPMMEKVFGVEEQGADGDGAFRAATQERATLQGETATTARRWERGATCGCSSLRRLAAVALECCTCYACWERRCKIACRTPSTTRRRGRRATGGRIKRSG